MSDSSERDPPTPAAPFWRKPLEAMSNTEWESLCDGCGRCCLVKLEDEDTAEVHFTDVACTLLSAESCACSDYANRQSRVPDCVKLTPEVVRSIGWLPPTCGYRIVAEGRDLPWWHPAVSGRFETVVEAGVSVRGKVAASEDDVPIDHLPGYIVSWPMKVPKRARGRAIAAARRQAPPLPSTPSASPGTPHNLVRDGGGLQSPAKVHDPSGSLFPESVDALKNEA